ncbi:MAG: MBL fold metallo-hydrolase [Spirochaetales bacterium]|nr:MBL fold metallo-hydrolase [Spirochaetales bacterium]
MEIKILVDNNTIIDEYYLGEPAVSYLIIEKGTKILFDVGYSDIFISNAGKMKESLKDLDYVVLSHGHNDHTGGLEPLVNHLKGSEEGAKTKLVAHEDTFLYKEEMGESIGSFVKEEFVKNHFDTVFTTKPLWLTENLVFLGEIERSHTFENKNPIGKYKLNDDLVDDYLKDDSALAYKSPEGLVIITGCSHAGICNIIDYAKKVCREERIVDVLGGFHMLEPTREELEGTMQFFKEAHINRAHPCHCTSLDSKIHLSQVTSVEEVGVGQVLKYL